MLAAILAIMAIVYSNCAPAETENREGDEENGETDQLFYNLFCKSREKLYICIFSNIKD